MNRFRSTPTKITAILYFIFAFLLMLLVPFTANAALTLSGSVDFTSDDVVVCSDGKLYALVCPTGTELGDPIAFPGCEGVGCNTRGGAGGTVYKVTTLNDSGSGSFREAMEASGPRIIVFDVSGIINLTSDLNVYNPYFTVAGQTSPGGIIVAGRRVLINTNDFIIRHMRFRTGTHNNGGNLENSRSMEISGPGAGYPGITNVSYNGVLDHNSFSWGTDQVLTIESDAYDITVSWNFIAEPIDGDENHGFNLFFWGRYADPSRRFSVHHNYTGNSRNRNPEINYNGKIDFVNNVNYNSYFGGAFSMLGWPYADSCSTCLEANVIGNYNKYGPITHVNNTNKALAWIQDPDPADAANPVMYISGNIGEQRTSSGDPEVKAVNQIDYGPFTFTEDPDADYFASTPFDFGDNPITATTMDATYAATVVANAGATLPVRDAVDTRLALDFTNETGTLKESATYPDDWPDLETGAPAAPTDSDNDGMPDDWETANGLNVGTNDSATVAANEIYTNIERYFQDIIDGVYPY